ncbi:type VI secretion system membrane subunit TssM [Halarcobacter ebronensis]|uniref:Type VI secretion system membrane subunit TssM n=1 Tax=Halarcobacter ebronensis TaxID=1462615 RepID=A0A4Q0YAN9_9BACT|nr:type VI secretion system membrane subunit TssM [Halarcobacter ebronensis]RXJ67322.1 type VI secretion system membrane subunit TssM [Halarcobacter ebronensis]
MKKSIFKRASFWILFSAFLISLFIIFATPYLFESYKDLNFRLLVAFCIFFGTIIILLLAVLFKKEETQDAIKEKKEQLELEREYKKVINEKKKDLRSKFYEAIRIIKKSSLYRNKRKAKYELPWYLVVGNTNEGKTTLLESSGLSFPLNVDYSNNEVIEEKTTNAFQWYFAEHSVFIDMPGNYIEQKQNPEDPVIWKEFLRIFTKKRWRRPINGIILPISAQTIIEKSELELEQYAKDLRDRFDELSKAFMSSGIPIYLIFTKSDKIEGFNEYFSTLTEEEKNEILGITFDSENRNIDSTVIKPLLEDLIKRLNSSVLEKLHYEWEEKSRGKIFSFCENFSNFFEKANLFIEMCFSQTRYRKPLLLRGVYFTSVPGKTNEYALIPKNSLEYSRSNTKGLFIKKLLNDIIFPESEIIKMDDNYKKKIKRDQRITYGVTLLFITFFSIFIIQDFIYHNNLLTKLEKNYEIYLDKKDKIVPSDDFVEILETINKLNDIKKYNDSNTSSDFWKLLFFKVDERKAKLNQLYHTDLVKLLLPRIAALIKSNIKAEINDFDKTWDNTKAYIMLNQINRIDAEFLSEYVAFYLNKKYANMPDIQKYLNYHWQNLLSLGFNSYEIDTKTLKFARTRLIKFGIEQLAYKEIKNQVAQKNLNDFIFANVLGNNVSSFGGSNYVIPGFYTKKGYKIMINEGKDLTSQVLLNNWVLGERTDFTTLEISDYYKKILSFYFNDYKNYWNKALSELKIETYSSIIDLNNQLSLLSSADSPIISILTALKKNTQLYTPEEEFQMKSDDKVKNAVVNRVASGQLTRIAANKIANSSISIMDNTSVKSLREFFKPYNVLLDDEFQASSILKDPISKISNTYQLMTSIQGAITPDFDSFKIVKERIDGKLQPIVVPLNFLPIHVKKWFTFVLQSNWNHLLVNAKAYINKKYKDEVYSFYDSRLKNKYPFNKKETNNFVKLDDFSDFFRKSGVIDSFYNNYLSNFVTVNSNTYEYSNKNLDGSMMNIDKSILQGVLRAYKIRSVFFKNSGTLGFDISLKPRDLSGNLATMFLFYDNQSIYYEHGPIISKKIYWPPKTQNSVVKFKLYDLSNGLVTQEYIDNDWSLFKLLDNFTYSSSKSNEAVIVYKKGEYDGSFFIKGSAVDFFGGNDSLSRFYLSENL